VWSGVGLKQSRCYLIDSFVGTLSTEYHRHKQFEGVAIVKLGFGHGHGLLKIFYEEVVFVLSFHVLAMMIFLFNYRHKGIKISEITVQGETYLL
jgi:hypothetical protein